MLFLERYSTIEMFAAGLVIRTLRKVRASRASLKPAELRPADSGDSREYSVSVATSMTCYLLRLPATPKLASIAASGRARSGCSFVAEIIAGVQGTAPKTSKILQKACDMKPR